MAHPVLHSFIYLWPCHNQVNSEWRDISLEAELSALLAVTVCRTKPVFCLIVIVSLDLKKISRKHKLKKQ